jgi:hypothetical protein
MRRAALHGRKRKVSTTAAVQPGSGSRAETDESVIRVPDGSGKVQGSCGGLGTSIPEAAHEFSN